MYLLKKVQIAHRKANKTFIKVSSKYVDFVEFFEIKLIIEFINYIRINNYAIKLLDD